MARIITDTNHPRKPFVECHEEDCGTSINLTVDPSDWRPGEVYDILEAARWSTDPAYCPEHRPDLYDKLSEADRRAIVDFVITQGRYLGNKEDWDMEDNYQAAEGLHEIYHRHVAHDTQEG